MSTDVFPSVGTRGWSVIKTPNWGTRMQRSVSGRTLRTSDYVNPIWNFTLTYPLFYDNARGVSTPPATDLRTIMDFFNSRAGAFDNFLFDDPNDDSVTGQTLIPVPTDLTGTLYQLVRQLVPGGFQEWIIAPNLLSTVYVSASPVSPSVYSLDYSTGILTFMSPPGGPVSADFTYYFNVYFEDSMDFEEFVYQLWTVKKIKLTSIVL
jgi:uncharacterized protein (TIGR02217 family)